MAADPRPDAPPLTEGRHALRRTLHAAVGTPPPEIDSRVQRVTFASRALGVSKTLYVFLPPAYHVTARRFPALYLLRGHEREWVNPHEDASRHGTVIDVYLELLAAGTVGPMILVFPGVTSNDGRVHGLATDFRMRHLAPRAPGVGSARFETYLVQEVIPLVDALFRTIPDGRHRGLDGFSLGGFMAVKLATQHAGLVATVGAYDGTFLYPSADGTRVRDDDRVFNARLFDAAFGRPRDQAFAAANNPANLIMRAPASALRRLRWMLQYGPKHIEPMGSNYYRGAYVRGLLAAKGIRSPLPAVIPDGTHNWATADRHMAATLPLHWEALR